MEIMRIQDRRIWVTFCCIVLLLGCSGQRKMMPTPNIYINSNLGLYEDLAPDLKTSEVPVFYVTDRVPEKDENGKLVYGYGRSPSLAFGKALIGLGDDLTWEQLEEASRTSKRLDPVVLKLLDIEEIVRGPNSPIPFTEVNGKITEEESFVEERAKANEVVHQAIARQLALSKRKEVFIFVHGYHDTFEDGVFVMAELWHFLGRYGVPIAYTWPAGHPGLFGYVYDGESTEFTVYHLRQLLTLIASFPEVEKINLIGHSRGTDVVVTALRELTMIARSQGLDPKEVYKIHNFIIAAPDIDLQVAIQRMIGDHIAFSANRFTIYSSPKDKAMGASKWFNSSPRGRLGTLGVDNMPKTLKSTVDYSTSDVSFIYFSGKRGDGGGELDHSYFRKVPSVSSDLILMLREDIDPGPPGRPLKPLGEKFWQIPKGYPARQ
jgi:esterase/lipase superfamily enzyme